MATKKLDPLVLRDAEEKQLLDVRRTFLLRGPAQIPGLPGLLSTAIQNRGITYWEQLGCVGYNPQLSLLEATITIKRASGYTTDLCQGGSFEHVRFFVDWQDGTGWHDVGVSSVRVHNISDLPPGDQHPLQFLVQHMLDASARRRFCRTPVIPRVRAVLSWNAMPPTNPNQLPLFGNRVDVRIQLAPRRRITLFDLQKEKLTDASLLTLFQKSSTITFNPQPAEIAELAEEYKKAEVSTARMVVGAYPKNFAKPNSAKVQFAPSPTLAIEKIPGLNIDEILAALNNDKANTTFEQLTCIGFDPPTETLGGVIRIKKPSGYSGPLCRTGSLEHVAFWADWNNDGTFEEYLGTTSVVVHDIPAAATDPIDYSVRFYSPDFARHVRHCSNPNVIGIRAVLSWSTPPSTTDPDDLQTWGNRLDAHVVLRPGEAVVGNEVTGELITVGGVIPSLVDDSTWLAYPNDSGVPGASNYRPWGGTYSVRAMLYNTGPARSTHFKVEYRPEGGGTWLPVTAVQTFGVLDPLDAFEGARPVTETAVNGWLPYLVDFGSFITLDMQKIVDWNTTSVEDGRYELRLKVTRDDPATNPAGTVLRTWKATVCNLEFVVHPLVSGTTLDATATLDIGIGGGACKLYAAGSNINIPGELKVVHPFFGHYTLDLQPDSAANGVEPTPGQATTCTSLSDDGPDAGTWSLNVNAIQNCGFTVTLRGYDRTLVHNGATTHHGAKAVGFAVFPA